VIRSPCRSLIFARHPLGEHHDAVFLTRSTAPHVVPVSVAAALETLAHFRPIEDHLRAIDRALPEPADRALARTIVAAAELISIDGVLAAARDASAESATPVRHVGILTCDRPEALHASAMSFAQDSTPIELVIVDDSRTSRVRAANLAALASSAAVPGCEVLYAGIAEKRDYARRLAEAAGVAPEIVSFALFGSEAAAGSIGANRNALSLACAGFAFLSTDDDTLASLAMPNDPVAGVRFSDGADPATYRFFDNRDELLAAVVPADDRVVDVHAAVLGCSLRAIASAAGSNVDLAGATSETIEQVVSGTGRVAATVLGVHGDSGMFAGAGFLMTWMLGGFPLGDDATYRRAVTSRELVRCAPCTSIRRSPPFMSTSIGLDHRTLLPPFMPVLRDEDSVFSATLTTCFEMAHVAHLPRSVFHAAASGRRYDPNRIEAAGIRRFADLVIELIRSTGFGPGPSSSEQRLGIVGAHFEHVGRCDDAQLLATIRRIHVRAAGRRLARLDVALGASQNAPPSWVADAHAFRERLTAAIGREDFYVPWDVPGDSAIERLARTRRLVFELGRLFGAWPAVVGAARHLATRGDRLARPLSEVLR
jgi:hypothetical protein